MTNLPGVNNEKVIPSEPIMVKENQSSPTIESLRKYLSETSVEKLEKDWTEIKALGLPGPTIKEYLKHLSPVKGTWDDILVTFKKLDKSWGWKSFYIWLKENYLPPQKK